MAKTWIVMGQTGEYSDRSEWAVMSYPTEPMARAHAEAAFDEARRIGASEPQSGYPTWSYGDAPNRYDPEMRCQYTGVDYYVMSVEAATEFVKLPDIVAEGSSEATA
jgi:hypothetical protein